MKFRFVLLLIAAVIFCRAVYVLINAVKAIDAVGYSCTEGNYELSRGFYGLINWVCFLTAGLLFIIYKDNYSKGKIFYGIVFTLLLLSAIIFLLDYFIFFA